jgi:hypothetical protein
VASARSSLSDLSDLLKDGKYTSLVSQLLRIVYDTEKPAMPDLSVIGSALQQLVGGLFGRFISSARVGFS